MRLYWITNIPTPYRNHRYRTMARVFPRLGIEFEVLYMAETEPNRHWRMSPSELEYPYTVHSGWHPVVRGVAAHFNPGLLRRLREDPPDIALIGGFACPTQWLAPAFLPSRTTRVMMVESNLSSARRMGRMARLFKRRMILPNAAFVVPGPRSWEYIVELAPEVRARPVLQLPNLVDEDVWVRQVAARKVARDGIRERHRVSTAEQLWVCPARLTPEKGLDWFLRSLRGRSGFRMLIAGDGPLRAHLEAVVEQERLPVTLLGSQDQDSMVGLYAAADLFVLPSLGDPSPLSAVEACAARLPLLVSKRIGNLDEVLIEGHNGWTLDPSDAVRSEEAIGKAIRSTRGDLEAIGRRSGDLFESNFDSAARVERLGRFFLELREGHGCA